MAIATALLVAAALAAPARAMSTIEFLASLNDSEIANFEAWRQARREHDARLDAYWEKVDSKRSARKKKRSAKIPYEFSDYVMTFPPDYQGPQMSPQLLKKYQAFTAAKERVQPTPPREMPTVADYLDAAKRVYGFTPERVSEKEFKRRYAEEAIALGLSKDQVVRVYALETGGIGTYDMQAGVHPIRKTGRPISSALGYAQLLDANSVNEVSKHGKLFIERLQAKLRNPNLTQARAASLRSKIAVLKRMHANAKRVPFEWERHQAYAKTEEGQGMHALNIDGDIGPMMQAMKLKGIKDTAAQFDRPNLTGAEMEIMNLAGPVTGLEMMMPVGRKAPVTNSFTRRAYYVNKMVIGLTGEQLLAELDRRMNEAVKTAGSQEFAAAFDSVLNGKTAER
jgi:hypothetical protein